MSSRLSPRPFKIPKSTLLILCLSLICAPTLIAQTLSERSNYIGILPTFLLEPYDTIDALEVNIVPLVYERRLGKQNDMAIVLRPVINYRFYKPQPGISQTGGTVAFKKYFRSWFGEDFWLTPQFSAFTTYTYNQLDLIHTLTLGVEPGVFMSISDRFSLNVNLQPGINYYPTEYSRQFVGTESGIKSHFGVLVDFGYNF